jgi:hypothetical protein
MKTRSGFVSNSSSSSFVVRRWDDMNKKPKKLLSAGDEKGLQSLGYTLQGAYYPNQITDNRPEKPRTKLEKEFIETMGNWCRTVTCNQEDEIYFLLKARISFMADIHYEHRSMIYDGKTDVLLIAQNFGKQIQMWGTEKMKFTSSLEKEPVHRTTGKAYLKLHKILS